MGRVGAMRWAVLLLAIALGGSGCAGRWAYHQGQDARDRGDWDLAVARYTRALQKSPDNISYKIALENARVQASRLHYDKARQHIAANDFVKAADELEIASKYDPANRSASDDLAIVRARLRKQQEEQQDREEFDRRRARALAARSPVPFLSPREQNPISMSFRNASLRKILESLGQLAGVNMLFDEGFRDKTDAEANFKGLTFEQALDRLTMVYRLFYKVLDQNTIIIVPESRQKRTSYDEQVLRTFYLQNGEVADVANLVKTLVRVNTVAFNKDIRAITIVGTVDQVAMAEQIIEANDKARGEVVVEVQILEINRGAAKRWGINLSNYTAGATLSPTGASGELTGTSDNPNSTLNLRAHVLSSLNMADWIVSLPSAVFTRFISSETNARVLAAPRLRAAEGKPAELKIGTEVPIPQTSYTVGLSGGTTGGYLPATSFTYRNVGVNMKITPRVSAGGEIELEMAAEFSGIGTNQNVGSKSNEILVPTFTTRNVTGVLRLRDGETALIGGLLQSRETSDFAGSLGMQQIPVLGKLLGARDRTKDETEVLMSITPRIVRGPKVTEDDLVPLRVGTEEVKRVEGARPSLFGPSETAPAAAPGSGPAGQPAPSTPARPSLGAPVVVPPGAPAAAPVNTPGTSEPLPLPPPAPAAGTLEPPPGTPTPGPSTTPGPAMPGTLTAPPTGAAPTSDAAATTPGRVNVPARPDARPVSALLSPPELSLRAGQSGGIGLVLVGASAVQWVEMTLTFDPTLIQVTDMAAGALLKLDGSTVQAERQIENGRARLRLSRATAAAGSGAVASITVRGLKPGAGVLTVDSLQLGGTGAAEQPALPAAARIVVAP